VDWGPIPEAKKMDRKNSFFFKFLKKKNINVKKFLSKSHFTDPGFRKHAKTKKKDFL
jgi:hypothetical protein